MFKQLIVFFQDIERFFPWISKFYNVKSKKFWRLNVLLIIFILGGIVTWFFFVRFILSSVSWVYCVNIIFPFIFQDGLKRLGSWQDESLGGLSGPGARGLTERAFSIIRAILLFSPPPLLQEHVLEFYSRTFSVHMSRAGEAEEGTAEHDEGGLCPGCAVLPHLCWCQEALEQLQELSHILWVEEKYHSDKTTDAALSCCLFIIYIMLLWCKSSVCLCKVNCSNV